MQTTRVHTKIKYLKQRLSLMHAIQELVIIIAGLVVLHVMGLKGFQKEIQIYLFS